MIEFPKNSRRKFLRNIGFISIGFPLLSYNFGDEDSLLDQNGSFESNLNRNLRFANPVNAWLNVLEDGRVLVYSGKVELGQGIRTAVRQVAAEELELELEQVEVHLAETGVTPDEGYTAGSSSIPNSAMSVRYAAATARQKLLELASTKLNTPEEDLILINGQVKSKNSNLSLNFSEILDGTQLEMEVSKLVPLKAKSDYRYVGKSIPRMDIEKMVHGEEVYIQDLRFPGMLHARVLRPAGYQSKLINLDESGLSSEVSGIVKTVVNGRFVGVITEREYQAVKAESYLNRHSKWTPNPAFPEQKALFSHIKSIAEKPKNIKNQGDVSIEYAENQTFKATFTKPYLKHGAIGPACGIAMYDRKVLHIWSHSQGIYPMRRAIAAMLKMDEDKLHVIAVPGAGCFGHSTADDAAADAAILAMAHPGKHIRVQWSRHDENTWDPYGTAMIMELEASMNANGKIYSWKADVWSDSHSIRPDKDPATLLDTRYFEQAIPLTGRGYLGGAHRNADPYYSIPNMQVNAHYFDGPLRVSSLRSLASYTTIFSIESFMDELAEKAGKDPLAFRLAHLEDERAIAVINKIKLMCERENLKDGEGMGYSFSRYKNTSAYSACAAKVWVDKSAGTIKLKKMWAAVDVGEIINLDGIINQIEGGMLQAASWTLKEQVTFAGNEITSTDWNRYPVFRFSDIPELEVAMIDRPTEPAEGGGEVSMPPTGAAIANAVYNACGKRVYNLPITAEKILG
ncbi:xanthine dehydrogenase family protein molybdopterin-binding subunit [Algoriphagus chordae]|uniref:CO/xanthine dehydrogenase Mo-binding subunit n=1 Tax=Algoriphagus chordae TaxID=237019 RepID=A0A2W7RY16_9BACT|nr:molybdopterin cofactor-binding domain-containing protein [Algoriphagus chordae]PZX55785.1 CO/xanthine dehydrogenase Mo-binding subunit [Algoriphagus chordae]